MNAQQVWQTQEIDVPRISLAYVRHVASDFDRRRRLRAAAGYVFTLVICAIQGFMVWQFYARKPLAALAGACTVLGLLAAMYRLYRHVSRESSPADAGVLDTLRYQRRQLERQRDWRRGAWKWNLGAILPGYLLILASLYFENDPVPWKQMAFAVLLLCVGAVLEVRSGKRKAQLSQREIDALDSLARDP
jgi:hypothetical protein